jgi:hypothetical protein
MIEHQILNSIWDCIVDLNLLRVFFFCFYFIVFSLSSYPFWLLRNLFNKSFIMRMIHLKSDPILLLNVYCSNLYVHWRIEYLSNNYIRCSNSFLLYRLYHPFWFILKLDFTPCMTRCSNSYRKYFSILYREGSTVQTFMTVEFTSFIFNIYKRKNNHLDERVICERPVKYSHGCLDSTRLQG